VDGQFETFGQQRTKPQGVPVSGGIVSGLRSDVVSFRIEPGGSGDLRVGNAIGPQDAVFEGGIERLGLTDATSKVGVSASWANKAQEANAAKARLGKACFTGDLLSGGEIWTRRKRGG
jgi:hypothetical protein